MRWASERPWLERPVRYQLRTATSLRRTKSSAARRSASVASAKLRPLRSPMSSVTGRSRERSASQTIPATLADPTHTTSRPPRCAPKNRTTRPAAVSPRATAKNRTEFSKRSSTHSVLTRCAAEGLAVGRSADHRGRSSQSSVGTIATAVYGDETMEQMSADEVEAVGEADYWVERVRSIRRFTRRDRDARAPYKPLLLLWLIGRLAGRQPVEVSFKDAELDLKLLMHRYRLGRNVRVAYPFVYLGQSPELWTVEDSSGRDVARLPQSTKESPVFLREEAVGTLAPEFELALHNPNVRSAVVNALLHMEFPETVHEEILHDVGLGHLVTPAPSRRDPNFKSAVLLAYENQCSFCGFSCSLRGGPVAVDAAHVKMRSKSGPDRIDNGLALCALHHRLFDRGGLGLNEDLRILVSQHMIVRGRRVAGSYQGSGRRTDAPTPARLRSSGWSVREVALPQPLRGAGTPSHPRASLIALGIVRIEGVTQND